MTDFTHPAVADFAIKKGALGPYLESVLTSAGVAQNLTGATITFSMEHENGSPKITNAAASIVGDPTAGRVRYAWAGTDTDTPGWYRAEWHVTGLTPTPARFPSSGVIWIHIQDAVG